MAIGIEPGQDTTGTIMIYVQLIGGGILLLAGGEFLVKGSVAVATRLGVSKLLIGLILVGLGTSSPELVACVNAAWVGAPEIAIGNVVGSNIANVLLILAVTALILPIHIDPAALRRDGPVLLASALLFTGLCWSGGIGRWAGSGFILILAVYLIWSYRLDRKRQDAAARFHEAGADQIRATGLSMRRGLVYFLGGLIGVLWGADLFVNGAITIARAAGLSEALIGLTLVAFGTSLPELVTCGMGAIRGHSDVAMGNILGSSIFNTLGIIGATALVEPLGVPVQFLQFDLWVMLAVTLLLIAFAFSGWKIERWEGGLFLAGYVGYLLVLWSISGRVVAQ
jgi:cation:H+ antiporter